jgi:2-dehydro-3-deoxyphosphogluconate aldolase/(4S)-4-hydroxy-2-oxoglutarate aldolase
MFACEKGATFVDSQFPAEMLERIARTGVIAVLVVDRADDAVPLAEALLEGGVDAIELTLRTPAALEAVRRICRAVPEMLVGMGTVLTPEQVDQAADAGAAFAVAPGMNPRVVVHGQSVKLPFAPGIMTASDIEAAAELGCRELKFFPAQPSGGAPLLKSLAAPYAHLGLRYIPLGGLNPQNISDYLANPAVLALGGSWIATRGSIAERDWQGIANKAREARQFVDQFRSGPRE